MSELKEFFSIKSLQAKLAESGFLFSRQTLYNWQKKGVFKPDGIMPVGYFGKKTPVYTPETYEALLNKIRNADKSQVYHWRKPKKE